MFSFQMPFPTGRQLYNIQGKGLNVVSVSGHLKVILGELAG